MEDLNVATIPQETAQTEQVQEETTPVEQVKEEIFKPVTVKFNKKEMLIDSEDKARELIQKGLLFDTKQKDLEDLPLTRSELEKERQEKLDYKIKYDAIALAEEKGWTIEDAVDYLSVKYKANTLETKHTAEVQKQQGNAKLQKDVEEVFETYPDIKAEDLSIPEITDMYSKGTPLITAYELHLANTEKKTLQDKVAELEQKLNIQTANEENAQSAVGSVTGGGETANTELTEEDIEKMSASELAKPKNWERAKKLFNMK